jgi:hypothetical protein
VSGLAIKHFFQSPQSPTYKFWIQHFFFPSFFHSNKPLARIPPAQAAPVFVAFSGFYHFTDPSNSHYSPAAPD